MAALLKRGNQPNIVQTLEHALLLFTEVHLQNIAHGCNSVLANETCAKYADYAVTEAGFGADLELRNL